MEEVREDVEVHEPLNNNIQEEAIIESNLSKNEEQENHTRLHVLMTELDHLKQNLVKTSSTSDDTVNHLESKLCKLTLAIQPLLKPEPIDDFLHQYTKTLCLAQLKNAFTNTLLQDIPIFHGNDSSQLEDWIMDIETAADLTHEGRTKLAQVKSKGLARMLITEARNLARRWEEIKDLLHLELCSSDIHTAVSRFLEIQQRDSESLAAFIHRFKREAKRCHFDKNPAAIRIFIKGLKNTHVFAPRI